MNEIMLPREKALKYGISCLSNYELLALIIKSGYKDSSVYELSDDLLELCHGFDNLLSLSYEELTSIKGIKKAKALEIMAILEIAKRLSKVDCIRQESLDNPNKVIEWLRFNIAFSDHEEFFVVYLNGKGGIIKYESLFRGSKSSSIVAIDEVLRKALLLKTSAILVAHNHPSGNVEPSRNDINITTKLKRSCEMLDIPLLDHIIVSKESYFSFKNHGLL
ncbi:MAG: DNA repair protein RadC [Firmicutes bacterium]|nr:DNA repair protein RadC [Candidatus Colivicinus equi]